MANLASARIFKAKLFQFMDTGDIREIRCAAKTYIILFEILTGHFIPPVKI